jgi:hypothetical protein
MIFGIFQAKEGWGKSSLRKHQEACEHACKPSTQEAEAGGLGVLGQPGLHRDPVSNYRKKRKKERKEKESKGS